MSEAQAKTIIQLLTKSMIRISYCNQDVLREVDAMMEPILELETERYERSVKEMRQELEKEGGCNMSAFEKTVHGNLADVIRTADTLMKEGKDKLAFRSESSLKSSGMDVTIRIYQKYNLLFANSTCIILIFQDKKDGNIRIIGLSAGDEYGIFGLDLGKGERTAKMCEKKLKSMDERIGK